MIKYIDEQSDEEIHRARSGEIPSTGALLRCTGSNTNIIRRNTPGTLVS